MRPPSRLMKIENPNMKHHKKNFCDVIMTIFALKNDVKEREAMEYMRRK